MPTKKNICSGAYSVVIKRPEKACWETCLRNFKEIVTILFFYDRKGETQTVVQFNECVLPPVAEEELWEICSRTDDNKVPGWDDIITKLWN